jgi:hypothetical protein
MSEFYMQAVDLPKVTTYSKGGWVWMKSLGKILDSAVQYATLRYTLQKAPLRILILTNYFYRI